MIVLKFGGSSVRDPQWIGRALSIVESCLAEAPLVVSSAMGKTTDALVAIGHEAARGETTVAHDETQRLIGAHRDALVSVSSGLSTASYERWRAELDERADELVTLVDGLTLVREATPRTTDALLSFGERMATTVLACAAEARGIATTLLDSRALVRTDGEHGRAMPDLAATRDRIRAAVDPRPGHLYLAQGFLGSTEDGITTTLGRGGSDFSATIYGAALDAARVEIWTDVDGIMTADPRKIPSARTIPEVSYNEAAELAYFGAKVVHPATMIPAVERGIPVIVCNTGNPDGKRTRIVTSPSNRGLRAIAGRAGVTVITVHSSRMLNAWGYLGRIFTLFERHHVSVDLVATSEVSVSASIDVPNPPARLLEELGALGTVSVQPGRAVISLVGEGMWRDARRLTDVFDVVRTLGRPVDMISLGSSDTNLSLIVEAAAVEEIMTALHRRFFDAPMGEEPSRDASPVI